MSNLSIGDIRKRKKRAAAEAAAMGPPTAEQIALGLQHDLLSAATQYGQGTYTPKYGRREARLEAELKAKLLQAAKGWVAAVAAHAAAHAEDYEQKNSESLKSLAAMRSAMLALKGDQ